MCVHLFCHARRARVRMGAAAAILDASLCFSSLLCVCVVSQMKERLRRNAKPKTVVLLERFAVRPAGLWLYLMCALVFFCVFRIMSPLSISRDRALIFLFFAPLCECHHTPGLSLTLVWAYMA